MNSAIRVAGIVLVSSALLLGGSVVAVAADVAEYAVAPVEWKPCDEQPDAECAAVTLPIDYRKPDGEKFGMAVARRKATDPANRIGALVINPGGPGGSGVNFALGTPFSPEVMRRFDIIGFDPRGVARSKPVTCSAELVDRAPSMYPKDAAEFDQYVAYNRELREDCRKQSGGIFDHASTADVAQDIDALRRALGERKISYFGVSYGTIMGQHYAERYGGKIRAMVIDSTMDHSVSARKFVEAEARGAEDSFQEWAKWNARTPSSALHGQDVVKIWEDLLVKAGRGQLSDPFKPDVKLSREEVSDYALRMAKAPTWAYFAEQVKSLRDGTTGLAAQSAPAEQKAYPFPAVFCNDYDVRIGSYNEYKALIDLESRVAPHVPGSSQGHQTMMRCLGYPKASNPQRDLDIRTAPKILLTNPLHDPATVYEWAVNVHRQSRETTVFVTYEGWGHGVYRRSDCTRGINDSYLLELKLPADGTRCAGVEPTDGQRSYSSPNTAWTAG